MLPFVPAEIVAVFDRELHREFLNAAFQAPKQFSAILRNKKYVGKYQIAFFNQQMLLVDEGFVCSQMTRCITKYERYYWWSSTSGIRCFSQKTLVLWKRVTLISSLLWQINPRILNTAIMSVSSWNCGRFFHQDSHTTVSSQSLTTCPCSLKIKSASIDVNHRFHIDYKPFCVFTSGLHKVFPVSFLRYALHLL